jgi:transposase
LPRRRWMRRDRTPGAGSTALYRSELERWRQGATEALADPGEARASRAETQADRKRIKELERELLRKDKALAETAALLVLSKKLSAIFPGGADE